jgi:stigma-specific protein Stig1
MPLEVCGGTCMDIRSDPRNCGACGHACGAGLSCSDGQCAADGGGACAARSGGAFVTLEKCGETVKLWITNGVFVASADALLRGEPVAGIPVLDLRAGSDCDAQWTWHADEATASFAGATVGGCDVCPSAIERALSYYVLEVRSWCPSPAKVVAVDHR